MGQGGESHVLARDVRTSRWTRWEIRAGRIDSREPAEGPEEIRPNDPRVAPAFWDIQTNGRWGISFSDGSLTVDQVGEIVRAQGLLGTGKLCPTLITAERGATEHGLRTIAAACRRWPEVERRVAGIHLEGPYISEVDGYRGAHPREAVRDPDWAEFLRFQEIADGRVRLMTLAPERPGALDFIAQAGAAGIVIALGHTAADGPTLDLAARAGARLTTHLGNGIAAHLPRHPNPIWHQAADDRLMASLIVDGHHLDPSTVRVLVRAKTPARTILISDHSPLAGMPAGTYGPWAVDPSGKIVVAGTPYLAGSNQNLDVGIDLVLRWAGVSPAEALAMVVDQPARLLDMPIPRLNAGEPADLVVFENRGDDGGHRFVLRRTCLEGVWSESESGGWTDRPIDAKEFST